MKFTIGDTAFLQKSKMNYILFCTFANSMTKYNTHTLKNGLRIIHLPSASQVVYCGYGIAAGTRDERMNSQARPLSEEGLAHFCEHMTFKGTAQRNALQIINALEGVGGELNAFTNKEDTVFYAAISKEHFTQAVDVLTDIVFHSQYPQHEIDKEVEVICDEIESYNDTPAELIYDEFENLLFEGHPLGHNILGNAEQLRTYKTEDFLHFVRCHYRPDNAVFFVYGDISFARLVKKLENLEFSKAIKMANQHCCSIGIGRSVDGQSIILDKGTHQAHVMLGTRSYAFDDPRRMTLYLLNNILGGPGMNARLNLSLRERHGLVYTVESIMTSYSDTGIWSVYFGCDHADIRRCLRLVRHELDRMMIRPLSERQLSAAKRQLKGQIAIACDNREQFALDFGKSYLHLGQERDLDRLFQRIDAIKAEDIQQVARKLFVPERLTTLIFR